MPGIEHERWKFNTAFILHHVYKVPLPDLVLEAEHGDSIRADIHVKPCKRYTPFFVEIETNSANHKKKKEHYAKKHIHNVIILKPDSSTGVELEERIANLLEPLLLKYDRKEIRKAEDKERSAKANAWMKRKRKEAKR